MGSRPFEGVRTCSTISWRGGRALAVCTNKVEKLSKLLLRELELDSKFAAIAGRDTFAVFKPAAGHLLGTIEMAGGRPERAVMVGDSEVDIATAAAANVPSIGVTFGYTPRPVASSDPTRSSTTIASFPLRFQSPGLTLQESAICHSGKTMHVVVPWASRVPLASRSCLPPWPSAGPHRGNGLPRESARSSP